MTEELLNVAVIGCLHGELEVAYASIQHKACQNGVKVDLVIICGDFQSVRDQNDLQSMTAPPKYRKLGDFHRYHTGELVAPFLTIFVGGNHESANFLYELPYGGWVARNIYFLGHSGCVKFAGLSIGGISGIFKHYDYYNGHSETPPMNEQMLRSFYHIRQIDIEKIILMKGIDIFISHDWPTGIWNHGNLKKLLSDKPFFCKDIGENRLGCHCLMDVLKAIHPRFYLAAHLHVHFSATYKHEYGTTEFIALDKVKKNKEYFDFLQVEAKNSSRVLEYDPAWIYITKKFSPYFRSGIPRVPISEVDVDEVKSIVEENSDLSIPFGCEKYPINPATSLPIIGSSFPDTLAFCYRFNISNPYNMSTSHYTPQPFPSST